MKRYYYKAIFGDGEKDVIYFSVVATNILYARKKASYTLKLYGMDNHSTLMKRVKTEVIKWNGMNFYILQL